MKAKHPARITALAAVLVEHRDGTLSWHTGRGRVLLPTVSKRAKIVHIELSVRK